MVEEDIESDNVMQTDSGGNRLVRARGKEAYIVCRYQPLVNTYRNRFLKTSNEDFMVRKKLEAWTTFRCEQKWGNEQRSACDNSEYSLTGWSRQ
jgi:hypothetical protein